MSFHRVVAHDGLRRVAEHLSHVKIEGLYAITLLEREMGIASGLAHHVHRRTLTLGNTTHMLNVLLVDEQTHPFLTLVGDDLLRRQGLVADGQLGHVDLAATLLDQLGETVQVACRTVVVDGDDGVDILLTERTHEVVGTLLHLRVGTLDGVQFNAVRVATSVN